MPILIWILALGGAAIVAKKIFGCPSSPPPNPFFNAQNQIDWNALQTKLGPMKDNAQAKAWLSLVVQYGKAIPVYGWYVAAVAYGVSKLSDWVADDANSDAWKAKAEDSATKVVTLGFIPTTNAPGLTLRDASNSNNGVIAIVHGFTGYGPSEPYLQSWLELAGLVFKKWGGAPLVFNEGMKFIQGGATNGPVPSNLFTMNAGALVGIANAVAYEYGVCNQADQVAAAALQANLNIEGLLPWKTLVKMGTCTGDGCNSPDALVHGVLDAGTAAPSGPGFGLQTSSPVPGVIGSPAAPYGYALGVWAAATKAAELAGRPKPPPITEQTVKYANGIVPLIHPNVRLNLGK